jgi:hypothetical protein
VEDAVKPPATRPELISNQATNSQLEDNSNVSTSDSEHAARHVSSGSTSSEDAGNRGETRATSTVSKKRRITIHRKVTKKAPPKGVEGKVLACYLTNAAKSNHKI